VHGEFALGWAVGVGDPRRRITVEIVEGAEVVAIGEANQPHEGLRKRNIGDGRYAFVIRLPASIFDGEPHVLRARDAKTGIVLQGEQVVARREAAHGEIEGVSAGVVFGWLPATANGKPPAVELRVDGKVIGIAQASLERPDIVENRIADSAYGFRFDLSPHLEKGREHSIAVVDPATGRDIAGSPFSTAKRPGWGVLDTKGGIELGGWVVRTEPEEAPAVIEVELDGKVIAEVRADRLRADLAQGHRCHPARLEAQAARGSSLCHRSRGRGRHLGLDPECRGTRGADPHGRMGRRRKDRHRARRCPARGRRARAVRAAGRKGGRGILHPVAGAQAGLEAAHGTPHAARLR
jgi:hypothetical protein